VWCKALAYITNRAIQERLDEVCGPENWQNKFIEIDGGFLCGIGIYTKPTCWIKEEEYDSGFAWVWKWDGAQRTEFESIKGGLSGAMKRAAVQWGIGRYLYDLEETWVDTSRTKRDGWKWAQLKDKTPFWWCLSPSCLKGTRRRRSMMGQRR
jgi:hypothetical protein